MGTAQSFGVDQHIAEKLQIRRLRPGCAGVYKEHQHGQETCEVSMHGRNSLKVADTLVYGSILELSKERWPSGLRRRS